MMMKRRGIFAALLGLPVLARPDPASAFAAARPEPPQGPIVAVNNGWNRVARRTTRRAVRQSVRPPRRGYPPPY